MGFEPTTASLEGWNSTTELRPPISPMLCSMQYAIVCFIQAFDVQAEQA
jgi:hypothetical protein